MSMLHPLARFVRRTRRVIAFGQLLAFAGALVFEGGQHWRQISDPSVVDVVWFMDGARAHNPLTCPACELLRAPARVGEVPRLPLFDEASRTIVERAIDGPSRQVANQNLFSRAPPPPVPLA